MYLVTEQIQVVGCALIIMMATYQCKVTSHIRDISDPHPERRTSNYDRELTKQIESSNASRCVPCEVREGVKHRRIEAIKAEILEKLGLEKPPNMTGKILPKVPALVNLMDHYGMQGDSPNSNYRYSQGRHKSFDDYDDDQPSASKVISFAQKPQKSWNLPPDNPVQYFNFAEKVRAHSVKRAHLWVFLKPSKISQSRSTATVKIFQVQKLISGESPILNEVHNSEVEITSKRGNWISLDIRKLVSQWFRHPRENMGIVIQAFDGDDEHITVDVDQRESSPQRPFIEVKTTKEKRRRTKRKSGLDCNEDSKETRCCRYPLTVDFEDFGWDWIIAPTRYEANYCSGECAFVFLQKYPHTHLVQQASPGGNAGPCCTPRKMSQISMIYHDSVHGNIIYSNIPGMVVDRCGCS
ncbi:MSTN (predicted) [Pycnogonum litorale]